VAAAAWLPRRHCYAEVPLRGCHTLPLLMEVAVGSPTAGGWKESSERGGTDNPGTAQAWGAPAWEAALPWRSYCSEAWCKDLLGAGASCNAHLPVAEPLDLPCHYARLHTLLTSATTTGRLTASALHFPVPAVHPWALARSKAAMHEVLVVRTSHSLRRAQPATLFGECCAMCWPW